MNSSLDNADYSYVIPLAITSAIIGISLACLIIGLVISFKHLHTVTNLLMCNTCLSSAFYCIVQCNNYVFLKFFDSDTSDQSCRWRGYFTYMSIVAVVYSYLVQATSRYFFVVLSTKYRWVTSLKMHIILIIIHWMIVVFLPLPAIITKDIFYLPHELCWVRMKFVVHIAHTVLGYYCIPTIGIIMLYVYLYQKTKRRTNTRLVERTEISKHQNRDNSILRNIVILFGIYIVGGFPTLLYFIFGSNTLYCMGLIFVALAVAVAKVATLILDRELRKLMNKFFNTRKTLVIRIHPNAAIAMVEGGTTNSLSILSKRNK